MAKKITIKLDTSRYRPPTQEELDAARRYIVRRSEAAEALRDVAGDEVEDAAVELAQIAMRYDIDPKVFSFDSSVNEDMMTEVAAVMDALEESLMEHLEHYATMPAGDDGTRYLLWGLVLALGHRGMGMRDTLHAYLWRMLRQTEALVVAAKEAKMGAARAASMIRSSLSDLRGSRAYRSLMRYRHLYSAPYVSNGGQATFPDGSPNVRGVSSSGLNAVLNVLSGAVDSAWTHAQTLEMERGGAVGYCQFRGSDYPCAMCDEEVGFHELGDIEYDEWPHYNCCCGRVPIYRMEELDNMTEYGI